MHWAGWIVVGLALVLAGWFAFEGGRALMVGDYITPKSGKYAGLLGPWSKVVSAVGIKPRSTLMKWVFVIYGAAFLAMLVAFMLGASWAWMGMIAVAVLGPKQAALQERQAHGLEAARVGAVEAGRVHCLRVLG